MRLFSLLCLLLITGLSASPTSSPDIVPPPRPFLASGALREVKAPVDLTTLHDNDHLLLVAERRGVRLAEPIRASFTTTGHFLHQRDKTPGLLPAGLVVNSYFVNASSSGVAHYRASLQFRGETVVALVTYPEITASHSLFALDGVNYDINSGIDLPPAGGPDTIRLSAARTTLDLDFVDLGLHDSFRILTVTSPPVTGAPTP